MTRYLAQLVGNQASYHGHGLKFAAKEVKTVTPEQAEKLKASGFVRVWESEDPEPEESTDGDETETTENSGGDQTDETPAETPAKPDKPKGNKGNKGNKAAAKAAAQ